jgi:hypothetical protein
MGWLVLEIVCLVVVLLAMIALGIFIGLCLLPKLGFSEGTRYREWLLDQKLGDQTKSLRQQQISYMQYDVDGYTITFQKVRFLQTGEASTELLPEDFFPPEENNA